MLMWMRRLDRWPSDIHGRLRTQFPELLATSAIKTSFSTLIGDIALVSVEDIHRCDHVDLVIARWPCQGMSMAGK
jgi:site-specific DNA-cytosine methylase